MSDKRVSDMTGDEARELAGAGHQPRPLPSDPGMLFQVEVYAPGHGWSTAAWTLTRGGADEIAAAWLALKDGFYTRAQVWRGDGRTLIAEYADPADAGWKGPR